MAIEVFFQTPDMNYSDTLDMFDAGRVDDARRGALAKSVSQSALRSLTCATHKVQDLFVIVFYGPDGRIAVHAKGCCDQMTNEAQRILDAEVNPEDAKWRKWKVAPESSS
jgi:hypothetical protein